MRDQGGVPCEEQVTGNNIRGYILGTKEFDFAGRREGGRKGGREGVPARRHAQRQ